RQTVMLGATRDGQLTAMRHKAINTTSMTDMQFEGPGTATRTYYASPAIEIEHEVERENLVLSTPMRAPVEGPGLWALESAMDELAVELGVEPLDLRLANYADTDPATRAPWSSKKLREAYEEGARLFGWRERSRAPQRDGDWIVGQGMASCLMGTFRFPSRARVTLRRDGTAV